jgi:CheY-like chemotaxis protein
LQRIFEPFEQVAANKRASASGGTGLGLAISDRLVSAMGGRLAVESTVGVGSRFHFELAMSLAEPDRADAAAPGRHAGAAPKEPSALRGTVLVVDDNIVNRIVAAHMLQHLGLRVVECEDGWQACDMIRTQHFDAILMDCLMPGLDGYEATRRIRADEAQRGASRLPIVALTANVMPGDEQRCLDAGMDAYLAKPFTRHDLHAVLGSWLHPADAEVT